ncbi:MAG: pyridoxal-dependent decarboxylase [Candidatus Promineifilaceae bacterium]|nr:pyridoxal-dependent decarboxylase [Candidatus Promineifilaceae bacterium]
MEDNIAEKITPQGEMDLEEFRRQGHAIVDWVADYLAHPDDYPVLSRVQPGQVAEQLAPGPPEQSEPLDEILADFREIILPGITHWNHPGFMAYFGISGSGPGILGEWLSAALNVNAMLWRTSPAATELEEVTLDWLRQLLGLPAEFRGIISDTASISSMLALAAAREALDMDIRRRGLAGRPDVPRLRLYVSEQTHSSVEKGAITLGIGQEGVVKIPVDEAFRLDVAALQQAISADQQAGRLPFCVVATVGTTSTTSVDPVAEIAAVCRQHGLWLHVDGAYGGSAAIVPEMRWVLDGVDQADSFVVNPHKWLFTPLDCSAFYVRDPAMLQRAFSLVPDYLQTSETGVTNYMDWGVQLGRRFRALKLWLIMRHFGREGLVARLREHIRLGQLLAEWIDADPDFQRMAPAPFSTVCFRYRPPEEVQTEEEIEQRNEAIVAEVNQSGEIFISPTRLNGRYAIRAAIGNIRTDEEMVRRAWTLIRQAAVRLNG